MNNINLHFLPLPFFGEGQGRGTKTRILMNIKSILTSAFLLTSFITAGAQTKYLNVQIDDGQYESFEVTPSLGLSWDNVNKEETPPPSPITKDTPVGTVGIYNGLEAVVVELDSYKYAVATRNLGATSDYEGAGIYADLSYGTSPAVERSSDGYWISPYNVPCYGYYFCSLEDVKKYMAKHSIGDGWKVPSYYDMQSIGSHLQKVFNESGTYIGHGWKIEGTETLLLFPAAGGMFQLGLNDLDHTPTKDDIDYENGHFNLGRTSTRGYYLCDYGYNGLATMGFAHEQGSGASASVYMFNYAFGPQTNTVRLICKLPVE